MIDEDGTPRLTDFGLGWMDVDATLWKTTRIKGCGTIRYMAPELFDEDTCVSTIRSDIYAFGMTDWVRASRCVLY